MSEVKLKNQRTAIKTAVTKTLNYLNDIKEDNFSSPQFKFKKSKFNELWNKYELIQDEIETESGYDEAERDSFENSYIKVYSKFEETENRFIAKKAGISASNATAVPSCSQSFSHTGTENETTKQVNLPKIDLPIFSGNIEEWFSFYSLFNSMIHENKQLEIASKFHYLRLSLKGEAADVIASFQITAENYEEAWKLLNDRYDDKRLIVNKHINEIFNIPNINRESEIGLRSILDTFLKHVRALKAIGRPTEKWDDLLIHLLALKIDNNTRKEWENTLVKNTFPTILEFTTFLEKRCHVLSAIGSKSHATNKSVSHVAQTHKVCPICQGSHLIYYCRSFLKKDPKVRFNLAKNMKLCIKCLRSGNHSFDNCSGQSCKKCNQNHNSLLHFNVNKTSPPTPPPASDPSQTVTNSTAAEQESIVPISTNTVQQRYGFNALLPTAIINVSDKMGNFHKCRVLLDSGSQSHFVTRELVKLLGLEEKSFSIDLVGINSSSSTAATRVDCDIHSLHTNFTARLSCLVLDNISAHLPIVSFSSSLINIPHNIALADPTFNITNKIDMLIGAGLFWDLLCVGHIRLNGGRPSLLKTKLGWLVSGNIPEVNKPKTACNISTVELNNTLQQFWKIEEINDSPNCSKEHQYCEKHFIESVKRAPDGKFVVTMPINNNISKLGSSFEYASKCFKSLEKRLEKDHNLKLLYHQFLREYLDLGHMKFLDNHSRYSLEPQYYLPHHPVLREASSTTKLRVVFNASAKTTSGYSLNDALVPGPTIQQELYSILLRFRTHKCAITGDISKMYRQILVNETQTPLLRILWRENPCEQIKVYELKTVTYGTSCAPFLATRCLKQLAREAPSKWSQGAQVLDRDFYVDDLLTGAETEEELSIIIEQLVDLLKSGGFELRKFVSNCKFTSQNLVPISAKLLDLNYANCTKTLGIYWNPSKDVFTYQSNAVIPKKCNKRSILSALAQLFDPLGLVGPVVVQAKILMQELWRLNIHWDESVPTNIETEWSSYLTELSYLQGCELPRCALPFGRIAPIEIHGFCDASEKAYGACIYARQYHKEGTYSTRLLVSKSRVAPIKTVSIPRLELCAAVLLTELMQKTVSSLNLPSVKEVFYWTDSTIVLAWLKSTSREWKTFVANRVGKIQSHSAEHNWHFVSGTDNPADIISRGSHVQDLLKNSVWWHGPSWLSQNMNSWPDQPDISQSDQVLTEKRTESLVFQIHVLDNKFIERFSSVTKLFRVRAWIHRFVTNSKLPRESRLIGNLSLEEIQTAELKIIEVVQEASFADEIKDLKNKREIKRTSKLLSLCPFLDDQNILRVGGRLRNSKLPYSSKHQILLPAKHHFTDLVIKLYHLQTLHSGPNGTISALRLKYWPLAVRRAVKLSIRKCIMCFRANPLTLQYKMGDLPRDRVAASRPFTNCGVDYFGPLFLRESRRRGSRTVKAYGAVFVCFSTRAVHFELVEDLTSEAFLACFKRFVARRGNVSNLYSDNSTTFVGANNEIIKLNKIVQTLDSQLKTFQMTWHFIPPRAPNFGGLWEAAVKSAKTHLKRVVGERKLTLMEMNTLLCCIESILNSRPISPMSSDPNDLSYLTPGHFLIGDSLLRTSEPCLIDVQENRLSKWQQVEQLKQHFWKRWHQEFLHQVQQKHGWKKEADEKIKVGQLVLIKEDNLPPQQWRIGRIANVHPGRDNIVRVATIKTSSDTIKRAVTKLCILPCE